MLLKSIKLVNFRQFKGEQKVYFATDSNKNVTIMMGENGTGKTTIAQAFTWCMYGDTDFDDKSMLNKIIANQLIPKGESEVRVELELTHNGKDYTVIREQKYKRELNGKIKAQNTTLNISYKKDGQQEFVKPYETDSIIKEILPKELSKYFFFDGERIDKMSKEIKKGKSKEFAEAVRGLLGLNAFIAALEHLKPTSKYGVIGSYNESYDSSSDLNIAKYTKEIQKYQEELNKLENRLIEIENEMQLAQEKCDELNIKIQQNSESEKLYNEKEKLKNNYETIKKTKQNITASLLKQFNSNAPSYFAKSMIKDTLSSLAEADKIDKGIPDMHARTIEFLIKRGVCVCGNKIEFGNEAYKELNKALEFLPPQSIGIVINQFVKESEIRIKTTESLFENIKNQYAMIREYESTMDEIKSNIKNIEEKLINMENISVLQQSLMRYEKLIRDLQDERDEINQKKGSLETSKRRAETQREELTLRDEKNRKIEIYKAYAQYLFDEITKAYKQSETEVRERLEEVINEIFKSIYEGGMSLSIDEKYNIQVTVDEFEEFNADVETSTAQSISVIFAFISGIIKLARENSVASDAEEKMLESEPYPLVMDAPLSAFDKRRIQTVCEALPQIAEQVIIFIKDTDGELAEKYMSHKIGYRYMFDKKNEFETILLKR